MREKLRAVFVMEQHIGHRTYYENLRRFVDADARVDAHWVPITYDKPDAWWNRFAFVPANLRGSLNGRAQAQTGLAQPYDIAFFNTQVPAALAGAALQKKPYIVATDITPRQYDAMGARYGHHPDRFAPLREYKYRTNVKLFRNAARILPWSHWTRESLVRDYGADEKCIEVIPPGVDTTRWAPLPTREPHTPLRILFVGGDIRRKGGATLLEAYQRLPNELAELWLVTRTPAPEGKGLCPFHGLRPNQPELVALYQQCDVFVLPTEAEAFGIAAIEASAAGLPMITTNVGGLTDVVANGTTGFLIEPGNANALYEKLWLLLNEPTLRERMGAAARARALSKFDARRNALRIVEILCAVQN